jgi:hypothetical protein
LLKTVEAPALRWLWHTNIPPSFGLSRHLTVLDDYLVKVAKGEINRLIITMPPNGQFSVESTEIRLFKPSRTQKPTNQKTTLMVHTHSFLDRCVVCFRRTNDSKA